jgi:hypothetical protein
MPDALTGLAGHEMKIHRLLPHFNSLVDQLKRVTGTLQKALFIPPSENIQPEHGYAKEISSMTSRMMESSSKIANQLGSSENDLKVAAMSIPVALLPQQYSNFRDFI